MGGWPPCPSFQAVLSLNIICWEAGRHRLPIAISKLPVTVGSQSCLKAVRVIMQQIQDRTTVCNNTILANIMCIWCGVSAHTQRAAVELRFSPLYLELQSTVLWLSTTTQNTACRAPSLRPHNYLYLSDHLDKNSNPTTNNQPNEKWLLG